MEELEDGKEREGDDDSSSASIRLSEEDYAGNLPWMNRARDSTPLEFIQAVRNEVASDVRYGFAHLALFYVVMNNMVYCCRGIEKSRELMIVADFYTFPTRGSGDDTIDQVRNHSDHRRGDDINAGDTHCGESMDCYLHAGS